MEIQSPQHKRSGRAHLILGVILMFLGLFLIAEMADIVPWRVKDFIFTWQVLLIILGLVFMSNKENKGTGIILVAIGSFFLLPRIIHTPHYWHALFWPVLLIFLGFAVILSARRGVGPSCSRSNRSFSNGDYLDDVDVFGGGDRVIGSKQFKGGKLTHIFGGSKYDFTHAELAPGRINLDVLLVFGGTKLIIPEGWNVRLEVTSIFGGFSDKRVRSLLVSDEENYLVITGVCLFGGGEVVNYV